MTREDLDRVVLIVISLGYDHWLKHGTPIRREDAQLVADDVAKTIIVKLPTGGGERSNG